MHQGGVMCIYTLSWIKCLKVSIWRALGNKEWKRAWGGFLDLRAEMRECSWFT